jgi:hypothetical protein
MAGRSILEAVGLDRVETVRFDQQPNIYTHGRNGCFCVTSVSQNAAILSHIQAGERQQGAEGCGKTWGKQCIILSGRLSYRVLQPRLSRAIGRPREVRDQ